MTNFQFLGVSSQAEDEEEEDQPLSLSWPESNRKRFTYLLIIPIVLPLWLTLPDVRKTVREAELVPLTTTQNKIVMCFFSLYSPCLWYSQIALSYSPSFSLQRSSSPSPSWVPSAGSRASPTWWCGGLTRYIYILSKVPSLPGMWLCKK